MMWDIGGHGISNTMSDRNRSRSPQPPQMRMPSPSFPIPIQTLHSQGNASTGSPFDVSMSSSYPPVAVSANYESYDPYLYPSMSRAVPAPFPPVQVVHHSKHHSSSKNKHNDHHKHSGHGNSHSHSQPRRVPSPSPMSSFPINTSGSFPVQIPQFHFPTVPHRPQIRSSSSHGLLKVPSRSPHVHFAVPHRPPTRSSSSNALFNASAPGYYEVQPPPKHSTKHSHKHLTKPTPMPHPDFQYSNCTGRRRALCIGINYRGQENELRGCINDAKNVRRFLLRNNYKSSEIIILTEESNDPRKLPTYDNILEAMRWLVHGARPHDSLFLHYSGHGGQTRDLDGDEADGWDEVIYPLDYKRKGHIVDDLMHDIMVKPLPRGCRLTGLFDACHSGSVLDLPFDYSSHGRLKTSPITPRAQASKSSPADVISWSACPDHMTSADTFSGGVAVGAMSNAFVEVLTNKPEQTYQELLRSIRLTLHPRYKQIPQLGSSHPIDTNLRFIF